MITFITNYEILLEFIFKGGKIREKAGKKNQWTHHEHSIKISFLIFSSYFSCSFGKYSVIILFHFRIVEHWKSLAWGHKKVPNNLRKKRQNSKSQTLFLLRFPSFFFLFFSNIFFFSVSLLLVCNVYVFVVRICWLVVTLVR